MHDAFETIELANWIWTMYGSEENVFLLPETSLTAQQRARLDGERVLIYRTGRDYSRSGSDNHQFPWDDRIIRYDPSSMSARGVRPPDPY